MAKHPGQRYSRVCLFSMVLMSSLRFGFCRAFARLGVYNCYRIFNLFFKSINTLMLLLAKPITMRKILACLLLLTAHIICYAQDTAKTSGKQGWQIIQTQGTPEKREDCSFVEINDLFYLIGGRGIKPVDVFNPLTNSWQHKNKTPVELNHFQAVGYKGKIYVVGAMNGPFPHEKPLENIYIYDPQTDEWQTGPAMPSGRLRGSGGTVVYNNKIYLVCGIQDGHYTGFVTWMDEFNPATGKWRILPDAPHARDHL